MPAKTLFRSLTVVSLGLALSAVAGSFVSAQETDIDREALPPLIYDPSAPTNDQQFDPPPAGQQQVEPPPADQQFDPQTGAPVEQGGQQTFEEIQPEPEKKDTRVTNPVAEFAGLDKITGRTTNFDVYINETVQFGALQVTPKVCYSRPDAEEPKTDTFVEVDEITLDRKIRRIFTGWMFAESPGLSAVEHPVYDIWLKACKQRSDVPPPQAAKSN